MGRVNKVIPKIHLSTFHFSIYCLTEGSQLAVIKCRSKEKKTLDIKDASSFLCCYVVVVVVVLLALVFMAVVVNVVAAVWMHMNHHQSILIIFYQ